MKLSSAVAVGRCGVIVCPLFIPVGGIHPRGGCTAPRWVGEVGRRWLMGMCSGESVGAAASIFLYVNVADTDVELVVVVRASGVHESVQVAL